MRLYQGKIAGAAHEMAEALVSSGDIEVREEEFAEVELDIASVLREYLRLEREIGDKARDTINARGLDFGALNKVRRQIADERGFGLGEEAIEYMVRQLIEMLMHSVHVDEVYAPDNVLRKKMADVLRRHMAVEQELDQEVRRRIRNLEEGTATWDVEYRKLMDDLKKVRKL